jgi:hypothetical protein
MILFFAVGINRIIVKVPAAAYIQFPYGINGNLGFLLRINKSFQGVHMKLSDRNAPGLGSRLQFSIKN